MLFSVILEPYQASAKLVTGKVCLINYHNIDLIVQVILQETSESFSKISILVMPLMTTVFQDIHAHCNENNQLLLSLKVKTNN